MTIDCIVPAHNEAPTIATVIGVLRAAGVFRRIIVVDDGSKDDTARIAIGAGANVLRLSPNGGKGAAMLAGVRFSDGDPQRMPPADDFAFFDADLVGLRPEIVHRMALEFWGPKKPDMVCGMQDHGWTNVAQMLMPLITGQRFVRRWIVEELPASCWADYGIETALNYVCDKNGGKTCLVPMKGVTGKLKQEKVGFVKGWMGHFKMARQMSETRKALETTGGLACRLPRK